MKTFRDFDREHDRRNNFCPDRSANFDGNNLMHTCWVGGTDMDDGTIGNTPQWMILSVVLATMPMKMRREDCCHTLMRPCKWILC